MSENIEKQKIKSLKEIYTEYTTCLAFNDEDENVKITDEKLINLMTDVKLSIWRLRKPKWTNDANTCGVSNPVDEFKNLVRLFGGPSYINNKKNGYAIWDNKKLVSNKVYWIDNIRINDECKIKFSRYENKFITTTYITNLNETTLEENKDIAEKLDKGHVIINIEKKKIIVNSYTLAGNIVKTYYAMMLIIEKMDESKLETTKLNTKIGTQKLRGKTKNKKIYEQYIQDLLFWKSYNKIDHEELKIYKDRKVIIIDFANENKKTNVSTALTSMKFIYKEKKKTNSHQLSTTSNPINWIYDKKKCDTEHNPVDRYQDIVDMFGKPTHIEKKKGGWAIWDEQTLKANGVDWVYRIKLEDECVLHTFPAKHHDFYYTTYKPLPFKSSHLTKIRSIIEELTESVFVDPLEGLITARCHFIGANVATIYLAMMLARDLEKTPDNAPGLDDIANQVEKIVCEKGKQLPISKMVKLKEMVKKRQKYINDAKKLYKNYIDKMMVDMESIKTGKHNFYNEKVEKLKEWKGIKKENKKKDPINSDDDDYHITPF
jgi:hypothetical protein